MQEIDFQASTVWTLGLDAPHEKFFSRPIHTRLYRSGYSGNRSFFQVGDFQLFMILEKAESVEEAPSWQFQAVYASAEERPGIVFGKCFPHGIEAPS